MWFAFGVLDRDAFVRALFAFEPEFTLAYHTLQCVMNRRACQTH